MAKEPAQEDFPIPHVMVGKEAEAIELTVEDLQTLRGWVKFTAGTEVGLSFVKSDNTGALAL